MSQLKTGPKIALGVLGIAALVFGLQMAMARGWMPTPGLMKALVPFNFSSLAVIMGCLK